jgi:lysine-specific demethylase/histidyl-hydroxylase NO66
MSTRIRTTRTSTRTTPTRSTALARAIEPVDADTFAGEYWETKPLHVPRSEPGRFDDLLSAEDAERLVTEPGLRHPAFRLVKAGARLDAGEYTSDVGWRPVPFTGTADVGRVVAEFEAGATVVLQGLHLNRRALAEYCRALEAWLGHPVQANAYLTPRHSQGLPVHHDTHDVFVLQVSGRKRWLVYEPALELPLKHQRHHPELGAPGAPVLDVVLAPGDTLYLPRGWLHEALTSDEDSLHITVGVNVYTWVDAVRAALARCEREVEFRRAVTDDGSVETLLELLGAELAAERVEDERRRSFVVARRPILAGQLSQLRALDAIGPDARVERRPTVIADLVDEGDGRVALVFEGKRVRFPGVAAAALERVLSGEARVGDLPGLDDGGRLVFVRRLVREGFLQIVS